MVVVRGGVGLEKALATIGKALTNASKVSVGFLADSTYPDGTSVPMVAALAEYGHDGTPPRPFFRTMIAVKESGWSAILAAELDAADNDAKKALGRIGAHIKADLQESIANFDAPALSPVTVMMRGMRTQARYRDLPFGKLIKEAQARVAAGQTSYGASFKPLIDTGVMLKAVDWEVE